MQGNYAQNEDVFDFSNFYIWVCNCNRIKAHYKLINDTWDDTNLPYNFFNHTFNKKFKFHIMAKTFQTYIKKEYKILQTYVINEIDIQKNKYNNIY